MPLAIPNELKPITPFVRRAEELDKDSSRPESRLVAYYCRQYAVHTGIPLASTSAGAKTCLGHLLETLERDKPAMDNFTRPEAEYLCRQFAYGIFDRADAEDRMDKANKTTAKTFYTSASFLQMLEQFYGKDPADEAREDKRRALYAKWKATEILKAIKEGRKPQSGGYVDHKDQDEDADDAAEETTTTTTTTKNDAPASEQEDAPEDEQHSPPPPPPQPKPLPPPPQQQPPAVFQESDDEDEPPPPSYPGPPPLPPPSLPPPKPAAPPPSKPAAPAPKPPPPKPSGGGWLGGGTNKSRITNAQMADAAELTRFALAALDDRDADLAAQRLHEALAALGQTVSKNNHGRSIRTTNAQMADAMELTRFAASAMQDHDAELAIERLEQALHCLGR